LRLAARGDSGSEFNEATPLAEDGFFYITDSWGVLYKIDGTSATAGASSGKLAAIKRSARTRARY
jgi:hypothetical protein